MTRGMQGGHHKLDHTKVENEKCSLPCGSVLGNFVICGGGDHRAGHSGVWHATDEVGRPALLCTRRLRDACFL